MKTLNKQQKEILQTQLDSEKKTINELKQVYNQALKDVNEKISLLSARADMNPPELQSIIYQKQYQQAIKGQLEGVMANLQSNEYATISDYLTRCYQDGYIGTMYDLQGQGIPLVISIDQEQAAKAIQIDSKLSKPLYNRLGEDVSKLKTSVRAEISRGIANGSSWIEVGEKISKSMKNTPFEKSINNSIRIARTEGHRIQNAATLDAQHKAKEKGVNIIKQWDSTLDGTTRDTHRQLDGQIREIDEDFEVNGLRASAPGMFGDPAEDCNCRCALLQRARWALDESELDTLKERAEYFGLDKTEDFEDFKEKYLDASPIYDSLFENKPGSNISAKQRYEDTLTVTNAMRKLPLKVKENFTNISFEFGHDTNSCDIMKGKINVGIGTTEEQVNHEYGHLIEKYMMNQADVNEYKMYLTKGLTVDDIKPVIYYDNADNEVTIYVLNSDKFESEYQSRLYIKYPSQAINKDGTININCLEECVSEPFRKYMNGEEISEAAKKLIEGAVL